MMTDSTVTNSDSSDMFFPLRRSNANGCTCGTCATCCDDFVFWNIIRTHRERIECVRHESMMRNRHNPQKYPLVDIPQCKCMFCVRTYDYEIPENLPRFPQPKNTHVRRANNNECTCMICATCVNDNVFFGVINTHDTSICKCMYCCAEQEFNTRYTFSRS